MSLGNSKTLQKRIWANTLYFKVWHFWDMVCFRATQTGFWGWIFFCLRIQRRKSRVSVEEVSCSCSVFFVPLSCTAALHHLQLKWTCCCLSKLLKLWLKHFITASVLLCTLDASSTVVRPWCHNQHINLTFVGFKSYITIKTFFFFSAFRSESVFDLTT